jgi:hypothetical protein
MATTQTGMSGATGTRSSTASGMQGGIGAAIPDTTYNLISVMYHTLQGCQTYEKYAQDAEQAGQQDVAQFFRETGRQFEQCAEHGQRLLAQCLQQAQGSRGQLNSQMNRSGQQSQSGTSSGQQNPSGMSSGQQSQSGMSSGQQGSGRSSSNMGSGSANLSGNSRNNSR